MHHGTHMEVRDQQVGVLFLPHGIQGLNSDCQAWWQASLPAESSFRASGINSLRNCHVVFCQPYMLSTS